MNQDEILKNKNAIVSQSNFEYLMENSNETGRSNFHYLKIIRRFELSLIDEVTNNEYLEDEIKDLKIFIRQLVVMLRKSVKIFDYSNRYNQENKLLSNNFQIAKSELNDLLDSIGDFASIIRYYERKGDYLLALKMRDFCFDSYCRSIEMLRKDINIDISKSAIKGNYNVLKERLKNSTSTKKIALLRDLKTSTNPITSNLELKKCEDYKKNTWFEVGLKFVTGEAQRKYLELQNYTQLALELGFKETDRPYFSESLNENSSPKNLFSNPVKINLLLKHCKENDIDISPEFLKKIPAERY